VEVLGVINEVSEVSLVGGDQSESLINFLNPGVLYFPLLSHVNLSLEGNVWS